jgi:hypothetical protein
VLGLGSRRLIGFSMVDHMRTELVLDALGMAVAARGGDRKVAGIICHADRGSQGGINRSPQHSIVETPTSTKRSGTAAAALALSLIDRSSICSRSPRPRRRPRRTHYPVARPGRRRAVYVETMAVGHCGEGIGVTSSRRRSTPALSRAEIIDAALAPRQGVATYQSSPLPCCKR